MKLYRGDGDINKMFNINNPSEKYNPDDYTWIRADELASQLEPLVSLQGRTEIIFDKDSIKRQIIENAERELLNATKNFDIEYANFLFNIIKYYRAGEKPLSS